MISDIILPIGTIVKLIESDSKVMIMGYSMKSKQGGYLYDYCGCEYPYGILNKENIVYFDKKDVRSILKLGYRDDEFSLLEEKMKK